MFQTAHIGAGNCVNIEQQIQQIDDCYGFHMQCVSRRCKYYPRYMYVYG